MAASVPSYSNVQVSKLKNRVLEQCCKQGQCWVNIGKIHKGAMKPGSVSLVEREVILSPERSLLVEPGVCRWHKLRFR